MIEKYTNGAWTELGKYRKYGTKNYDVSTFPTSMLTTGNDFEDYRIYGAAGGTGEQTENLFDSEVQQGNLYSGEIQPPSSPNFYKRCRTKDFISVTTGQTITINSHYDLWVYYYYNGIYITNAGSQNWSKVYTFTVPSDVNQIKIMFAKDNKTANFYIEDFENDVMLIEGSTAPTSYIPFGYQLNAAVGNGTTGADIPIYIGDTPLEQGEYVDYDTQKIYKYVDGVLTPTDPPVALPAIPTLDGTTVIDFNNSPKPDRMTADDIGWFGHKPKIYTNGQWVDMT